jgi:hypothetical protein
LVDSILSHSHTFGALRYRSCKKGIVVTPLAVPSAGDRISTEIKITLFCLASLRACIVVDLEKINALTITLVSIPISFHP